MSVFINEEGYKSLNSVQREIADFYYGLNGHKILDENEIMLKIGCSKDSFDYLLKSVKEKIELPQEKTEMIFKMSDAFYSMFKDVDRLYVDESLNVLHKKERNIIKLFYGVDGIHCLDYDELAKMYQMSIDDIDFIIESSIETLKSHFKNENSSKKNEESSTNNVISVKIDADKKIPIEKRYLIARMMLYYMIF